MVWKFNWNRRPVRMLQTYNNRACQVWIVSVALYFSADQQIAVAAIRRMDPSNVNLQSIEPMGLENTLKLI